MTNLQGVAILIAERRLAAAAGEPGWLHRRLSRPCCEHPARAHEHYRPGTRCGLCDCPRLRRRWI